MPELQKPREEWARVYTDQSVESSQVTELLRSSGYRVITFPTNGRLGPELEIGTHIYRGLEEIRRFIEEQK